MTEHYGLRVQERRRTGSGHPYRKRSCVSKSEGLRAKPVGPGTTATARTNPEVAIDRRAFRFALEGARRKLSDYAPPRSLMRSTMIDEAWNTFAGSRTFYGFGTAPVPPFAWGVYRTDGRDDLDASASAFRRMLEVWQIAPDRLVLFVRAADDAFARVQTVIGRETLDTLPKPGFMGEILVPGVGNLFSNDPEEKQRPFLFRMDMFRMLLGKLGLPGSTGRSHWAGPAGDEASRCLRAVAQGWIYHEVGHVLEVNGWIRMDPSAGRDVASGFYAAKLALVDRNRDWFPGNPTGLKQAIDGVGTDIRVERFGRWMMRDDMDSYFHYVHTIGRYAFDGEAVFGTPFARHRFVLTMLYDTGLDLAHHYGNTFGIRRHEAFVIRRQAFLQANPFHDFDTLYHIMRTYRDRSELCFDDASDRPGGDGVRPGSG